MKKVIIPLIIGLVFLLVGGSLVLVYAASHDWNFSYQDSSLQEARYETAERVTLVIIEGDMSSFVIERGTEPTLSVDYYTSRRQHYTFRLQNGTLRIEEKRIFGWNALAQPRECKVVLPQSVTSLQVSLDAGEITLQNAGAFTSLELETDLGSIQASDWTASRVSCQTDAGEITLQNGQADRLFCASDVGNLALSHVKAETFECDTELGSITGRVLEGSQIRLETEAGTMDCEFLGDLSEYTVFVERGMGECNLFNQTGTTNKRLYVSMEMGSVHVDFRMPQS